MTPVSTAESRRPAGKDYGYCNARVRGMKSRLFDAAYLERLMGAADLSGVIHELVQTEYNPDLEQTLIHGRTAAQVDEALKLNLVRTYRKVLRLLNEDAFFLVTTLLGRWDLFNLKSIVRGKHVHLTVGEIHDGLLPVGALNAVELDALAAVEDIRAVADTAATWGLEYAPALRAGYIAFARSGDLPELELELDGHYARWASERLRKRGENAALARRILGMQVDTVNLITVLRLVKADLEGVDPMTFFLEGGWSIHRDLFEQLAKTSDVDELLDRVKGTPYGKTLEDSAIAYLEENSLAVFERSLETLLTRRAVASGIGDPLGVGVVVSYLWAKLNEVTNLRIVVKGKAIGMPESRMRKELILV
ncbi:MAG: hypothetical protein FDZ70_05545 [Actinobacteria bacterium]|nr:MAG: hypothetical protein FDZ70_05545 [Actinomycetota bacterium]